MKKAIRFSIVLCAVSWIAALLFYLIFKPSHLEGQAPIALLVFSTLYMFIPLICGLCVQAFDKEKPSSTGLLSFKINKSWIVGWLLTAVIIFASIPVNGLFSKLSINIPASPIEAMNTPIGFLGISLLTGLFAGVTLNAVAAFGEEYAWRNYLVTALRGKKFFLAVVFIGLVWGIWHFPIILMGHNYPVHRVGGIFMMCAMTLAIGFIELYFVLKTKSVFPAAIIHGTFNALAGLPMIFVVNSNDLLNGMPGLAGIITLSLFCLLIYLYDRYISKEHICSRTLGDALKNNFAKDDND